MLQSAYLLAKIGADTTENERNYAEILPKIGNYPTGRYPTSPVCVTSWTVDSSPPELKGEMTARDRTIRTIQIGVRSEFLESKENHEKLLHRSSMRPKIQDGAAEKPRKGETNCSKFFQNSGIFARKIN